LNTLPASIERRTLIDPAADDFAEQQILDEKRGGGIREREHFLLAICAMRSHTLPQGGERVCDAC